MKGMWLVRTFIEACSILLSFTFLTQTPIFAQGIVDYSVTLARNPTGSVFTGNPLTFTVNVNAYEVGVSSFSGIITETITSNTEFTITDIFWGYPLNCTRAGNNINCNYSIESVFPETIPVSNHIVPLQIPIVFPPIRVVITPLAAGVITCTVTVGGNMPDPNPDNNIASLIAIVLQQGPGGLISIPTMRDWGMLILIVLLGITSLYFLRLRIREG